MTHLFHIGLMIQPSQPFNCILITFEQMEIDWIYRCARQYGATHVTFRPRLSFTNVLAAAGVFVCVFTAFPRNTGMPVLLSSFVILG